MRAVLEDYKDWAELDTAKLESLGITGKYIQRVKAAGVAAAEHTFTDAYRGVKHILRKELELASIEGRPLVLSFNPFSVVFSKKLVWSYQHLVDRSSIHAISGRQASCLRRRFQAGLGGLISSLSRIGMSSAFR